MVRPRRPPSQAWRAFLKNHTPDLMALDFFTVPTATFRVLQRHRASDRGMDGAATAPGVRPGGGSAVPDPRQRPSLWTTIFTSGQDVGHPRSGYCASLTMAERLCGAGDWLGTTRVP